MSTVKHPFPWEPANNGGGKRMWFLIRRTETLPISDRYHFNANGVLIRYASMAGAQEAANRLNKKEASE